MIMSSFLHILEECPGQNMHSQHSQIANKNIYDPLRDLYCRGMNSIQSTRSWDFGNHLVCTCPATRSYIFLFVI